MKCLLAFPLLMFLSTSFACCSMTEMAKSKKGFHLSLSLSVVCLCFFYLDLLQNDAVMTSRQDACTTFFVKRKRYNSTTRLSYLWQNCLSAKRKQVWASIFPLPSFLFASQVDTLIVEPKLSPSTKNVVHGSWHQDSFIL